MEAILKDIKFLTDIQDVDCFHKIVMYFVKDKEDPETYPYTTTLETQYMPNPSNDLSAKEVSLQARKCKNDIGKKFDIELYKFSVEEITGGKYVALLSEKENFSSFKIKELRRASYMSRADILKLLNYQICLMGLHGTIEGITVDGDIKKLNENILFSNDNASENYRRISISNQEIDSCPDNILITNIPIQDIERGQFLAVRAVENNLHEKEISLLIYYLKQYRTYLKEKRKKNNSIIRTVFFWKREAIQPFNPCKEGLINYSNRELLKVLKICYILQKQYPRECEEAREYSMMNSVKQLEDTLYGPSKRINEEEIEFIKDLNKKYDKSLRKIKLVE